MNLPAKVYLAEERRQSTTRIVLSLVCLVLLAGLILVRGQEFSPERRFGLGMIVAHFTFALIWNRWAVASSENWRPRACIALLADLGVSSTVLVMAGSLGSFFYPLFLWVVVGNGLRYGSRYLMLATVVGFVGFSLILWFSAFWRENLEVGVGLLAGIVILPSFFLTVLKRLNRLNVRLGEQLELAKAAEKAKGDFLASMSHEIRTPLNGVIGMAQMLSDAPLDAEYRAQVDVIIRSGEALLTVINDVLDFSKIQSGQLAFEEVSFDLQALMVDLVHLLGIEAARKDISLEMRYDPALNRYYRGDPNRLRQILTNLVGNGIKFTGEGSVSLEAERVERRGNRDLIVLKVVDTGIGIPADRREAIFDPFEQADRSTTRRYGGTGLGLSISRQLARLLGGDLQVESEEGRGSTFSLELELTLAEAPAPVAPARDRMPRFQLRALLVEDQRVNQLVARRLMSKLGVELDLAENGAEALAMIDPARHRVVFMDLHMPGMNGWDATREIRARGGAMATVPIVALTADADPATAQRALAEGMNAHLAKPLRLGDIARVLENLLADAPLPPIESAVAVTPGSGSS